MARSSWPARLLIPALAAPLMLAGALAGPWQATASAAVCQGWTYGQPPSPGTADNELNGVTVLSACDAWAVGTTRSSGGIRPPLGDGDLGGNGVILIQNAGSVGKGNADIRTPVGENGLSGGGARSRRQ